MKIILPLFLLLAAFFYWRYRVRRTQAEVIASYPYARFLDRRLAERRPELSPEQRALVFDGLQQYFRLCLAGSSRMVAMPSQAVDDAWHEFILFTRQYQKFCQRAFGKFLHHTPAEAMPSRQVATDGIKRAWRLACADEGIRARQPERLPLIFGLDARLGIAGGFIYALDCSAANSVNGDAFCASDIGCGGGCGGSSGSSDGGGSGDGGSGCGGGCGGGD